MSDFKYVLILRQNKTRLYFEKKTQCKFQILVYKKIVDELVKINYNSE